jgi:hypothetical protein
MNGVKLLIFQVMTLVTLISGCGFAHDEHLDGPYYLTAVDISEQMSLSYDTGNGNRIGRVSETVFAVGWDSNYFIAKRHPDGDKSKTEYYYLIRSKDHKFANPEDCVRGPFDEAGFNEEKAELKLPDFSRILSNLK